MPYIGQAPTQSAFVTDTFNGTGSQTVFTMSVAPAGTTSVLVAISGVLQDPSTYSVSGTTLTFSAAPPSGTGNISARYLGIPASGVTTTAYRTVTEFTATAGQTTFTPPSYIAGFINVYRSGARLGSADYTATNGTTVVLASGAIAGDLITVESFLVSSVLNAIPNNAASITQSNLASGIAGTGPAFSAYANTTQSISSGAFTKVLFQTESYDTNSNFASSRFTPSVAGYYQFTGGVTFATTPGAYCAFYKNGALGQNSNFAPTTDRIYGTSLLYCNGSTDYVEFYVYVGTTATVQSGATNSYFQAAMVRAA